MEREISEVILISKVIVNSITFVSEKKVRFDLDISADYSAIKDKLLQGQFLSFFDSKNPINSGRFYIYNIDITSSYAYIFVINNNALNNTINESYTKLENKFCNICYIPALLPKVLTDFEKENLPKDSRKELILNDDKDKLYLKNNTSVGQDVYLLDEEDQTVNSVPFWTPNLPGIKIGTVVKVLLGNRVLLYTNITGNNTNTSPYEDSENWFKLNLNEPTDKPNGFSSRIGKKGRSYLAGQYTINNFNTYNSYRLLMGYRNSSDGYVSKVVFQNIKVDKVYYSNKVKLSDGATIFTPKFILRSSGVFEILENDETEEFSGGVYNDFFELYDNNDVKVLDTATLSEYNNYTPGLNFNYTPNNLAEYDYGENVLANLITYAGNNNNLVIENDIKKVLDFSSPLGLSNDGGNALLQDQSIASYVLQDAEPKMTGIDLPANSYAFSGLNDHINLPWKSRSGVVSDYSKSRKDNIKKYFFIINNSLNENVESIIINDATLQKNTVADWVPFTRSQLPYTIPESWKFVSDAGSSAENKRDTYFQTLHPEELSPLKFVNLGYDNEEYYDKATIVSCDNTPTGGELKYYIYEYTSYQEGVTISQILKATENDIAYNHSVKLYGTDDDLNNLSRTEFSEISEADFDNISKSSIEYQYSNNKLNMQEVSYKWFIIEFGFRDPEDSKISNDRIFDTEADAKAYLNKDNNIFYLDPSNPNYDNKFLIREYNEVNKSETCRTLRASTLFYGWEFSDEPFEVIDKNFVFSTVDELPNSGISDNQLAVVGTSYYNRSLYQYKYSFIPEFDTLVEAYRDQIGESFENLYLYIKVGTDSNKLQYKNYTDESTYTPVNTFHTYSELSNFVKNAGTSISVGYKAGAVPDDIASSDPGARMNLYKVTSIDRYSNPLYYGDYATIEALNSSTTDPSSVADNSFANVDETNTEWRFSKSQLAWVNSEVAKGTTPTVLNNFVLEDVSSNLNEYGFTYELNSEQVSSSWKLISKSNEPVFIFNDTNFNDTASRRSYYQSHQELVVKPENATSVYYTGYCEVSGHLQKLTDSPDLEREWVKFNAGNFVLLNPSLSFFNIQYRDAYTLLNPPKDGDICRVRDNASNTSFRVYEFSESSNYWVELENYPYIILLSDQVFEKVDDFIEFFANHPERLNEESSLYCNYALVNNAEYIFTPSFYINFETYKEYYRYLWINYVALEEKISSGKGGLIPYATYNIFLCYDNKDFTKKTVWLDIDKDATNLKSRRLFKENFNSVLKIGSFLIDETGNPINYTTSTKSLTGEGTLDSQEFLARQGYLRASDDAYIGGNWSFQVPVNAIAYRALWGDIAEYYVADKEYEEGTLIKFGGDKEITIASHGEANGVVTAKPSFVMNTEAYNEKFATKVAMLGRVPVKIKRGLHVHKFDKLVASLGELDEGLATVRNNADYKDIIGIALEETDGTQDKVIAIVNVLVK